MILFIVISIVAIYAFGSLGLLFMPVMLLLIFVYYNIDNFLIKRHSKNVNMLHQNYIQFYQMVVHNKIHVQIHLHTYKYHIDLQKLFYLYIL